MTLASEGRTLNNVDVKQLRCFVGIIDAGSITRGARSLRVAQPALTNRMYALEKSIGVQLLFRSSQGVTPTPAGEVLYRSAKRILSDLNTVAEEVRSLGRSPAGVVRFACMPSSARVLARALTDRVLSQLPHVGFSFTDTTSMDTYHRLQNGDADLAFMFKDGDVPGLLEETLATEELFVVTSSVDNRFDGLNAIDANSLRCLDFILPPSSKHFGTDFVHRRLSEKSIALRVVTEMHSLTGIMEIVLSGKAATILPWSAVHDLHEMGNIRLLRARDVDLSRHLSLYRRADRPLNPAIEAVSRITIELVTALITSGAWRHASLPRQAA